MTSVTFKKHQARGRQKERQRNGRTQHRERQIGTVSRHNVKLEWHQRKRETEMSRETDTVACRERKTSVKPVTTKYHHQTEQKKSYFTTSLWKCRNLKDRTADNNNYVFSLFRYRYVMSPRKENFQANSEFQKEIQAPPPWKKNFTVMYFTVVRYLKIPYTKYFMSNINAY